jgi:2-keto-3-deoxy-L-rhamnonate aldolase RhmA
MQTNRLKAAARDGRTAWGVYVTQPARLQILSSLESGAMAITVPDVEGRETALDVVRAARYLPEDDARSAGPSGMIGVPAEA